MNRDRRVQEEIEFHIAQQTAKNIRAGMSPEDAQRDARVRFGGREGTREAAKDAAIGATLRDFVRDLRIAFRTLARTPSFAVTAILTFGLGLGASTAMFAVVKGVLLDPLPYPDSSRIVRLYQLGATGARGNLSHPNFEDWTQGTHSFEHMTEMQIGGRLAVQGAGDPQLLAVTSVSREFFAALRVRPARGPGFADADQHVGAAPVALVSAALWERMGDRPQPAGERLIVGSQTVTVVGVMPKGFDYPGGTAIWLPLDINPRNTNRTAHNYQGLARLRDGVTLEAAQSEISALSRRLKTQHGDATWMSDATAVPLLEVATGGIKPALQWLFLASVLLLMVALTNLSNLLVARSVSRRSEFAVQLAIGATPARMTRQLLAEIMALSVTGTALGLALAGAAVRVFAAIGPAAAPRLNAVSIDAMTLAFAAGAALAVAVVLALVATVGARVTAVSSSMAESSRTSSSSRRQLLVREALIVTEIALTVALVAGAGLLGRSLAAVLTIDPGYRVDDALIAEVTTTDDGTSASVTRRVLRVQEMLEGMSRVPGVEAVGLINSFPLGRGNFSNGQFLEMTRVDELATPEQRQALGPALKARQGQAAYRLVSPGYFKAMGIPLIKGRFIEDGDAPGASHVAVISQSLADARWPDQDPIGRYVQFGNMDGDSTGIRIVGVVGDVRELTPEAVPGPMLYVAFAQRPRQGSTLTFIVRGPASSQISQDVIRTVRQVDPAVPVEIRTVADTFDRATGNRRFNFWLIGAFSLIALVLAVIGVYGLMSFTVAQRTREMGIRMALGAAPGGLAARIVRRGAGLACIGVVAGLVLSLALTNLVKSLLFGVVATDVLTLAGGACLVTMAAVAASYVPARRILRQSPALTLRNG